MVHDMIARFYSVAMTEEVDATLQGHLIRKDGQEDLCFALYQPSRGFDRFSALLYEVVLPVTGDRQVHGDASFNSQYYDRVVQLAVENEMGIAFLHSHPLARDWQGMSENDEIAESQMAASVHAMTGLPLVGLTLSGRSGYWSGRAWVRSDKKVWKCANCECTRVVGRHLQISFCPDLKPILDYPNSLTRTITAWGSQVQDNLSRLRIAVVGLGSVGSILVEALSRSGVTDVKLIDFDTIKEVNLDRTLNAYREHVGASAKKVKIAKDAALRASTMGGFQVEAVDVGLQEISAFRKALDCDVIFSCVDRPWARSILNHLAYAHLIPVIDGGIGVFRKPNGKMRSAEWGVHVVGPGRQCLECMGQYSSGDVALEMDGLLDDPSYLNSLPDESPLKKRENVFAFSMALASAEMLKLIQLIEPLAGIHASNIERVVFPASHVEQSDAVCGENCYFQSLKGKGEGAGHPNTTSWP